MKRFNRIEWMLIAIIILNIISITEKLISHFWG